MFNLGFFGGVRSGFFRWATHQGKLNLWRLLAVVDTHFTSLSIANSTGARNRGFKLPISGKFKYRIFGESFS